MTHHADAAALAAAAAALAATPSSITPSASATISVSGATPASGKSSFLRRGDGPATRAAAAAAGRRYVPPGGALTSGSMAARAAAWEKAGGVASPARPAVWAAGPATPTPANSAGADAELAEFVALEAALQADAEAATTLPRVCTQKHAPPPPPPAAPSPDRPAWLPASPPRSPDRERQDCLSRASPVREPAASPPKAASPPPPKAASPTPRRSRSPARGGAAALFGGRRSSKAVPQPALSASPVPPASEPPPRRPRERAGVEGGGAPPPPPPRPSPTPASLMLAAELAAARALRERLEREVARAEALGARSGGSTPAKGGRRAVATPAAATPPPTGWRDLKAQVDALKAELEAERAAASAREARAKAAADALRAEVASLRRAAAAGGDDGAAAPLSPPKRHGLRLSPRRRAKKDAGPAAVAAAVPVDPETARAAADAALGWAPLPPSSPPARPTTLPSSSPPPAVPAHGAARCDRAWPDGRRAAAFADSTRKLAVPGPEGGVVTAFANGDVRRAHADGRECYFYAASGVWHTAGLPSGASIYHYVSTGQIEAHLPDGTKHVVFGGGRGAVVAADGVETGVSDVAELAPETRVPVPAGTDAARVWAGEW